MQCFKCGREIQAGDVFCGDCLTDMEKYPVKPGTPVLIPKRPETVPPKKQAPRRPAAVPEEQVKRLKHRLRLVSALLALTLTIGGALAWLGYNYIVELRSKRPPGQNYSSTVITAPTGVTAP